ncbi:TOMM propeptide domain protein [Desulfosporosinus orientis DSM 765]|uniref:TOMM propeptide domain protein n=1 Tax=Desulfosporosinus orientis (strain ATCC 19365 / DSM 765 / NCIMB 8382 / VKM B-1628 / Singapore I) TaxID=768706 RepID=G7W6U2_DESOD|nr:NHLP leader peptide family RiPP precursor [Desulfosporosinus orientis]AET69224.1 TOMM propeptide domain protein [Desulfosporosinus orientis DSM 765]
MTDQKENNQKLPTWQEFQNELIVRALKDESFRKELLADPKAMVEKEMARLKEGAKLPASLEIKVIEQPANALYLVLPTMSDELSDEALDAVAGGEMACDFCLPCFGCRL